MKIFTSSDDGMLAQNEIKVIVEKNEKQYFKRRMIKLIRDCIGSGELQRIIIEESRDRLYVGVEFMNNKAYEQFLNKLKRLKKMIDGVLFSEEG